MDEILVVANPGPGRPAVVGAGSQFFVVWTDVGGQDLKAASFGLSGNKFDEFQVNTTRGIAGIPSVARAIDGGFVACWVTTPPTKLVFQRIGEDGRKQGGEIVVSAVNVSTELDRFLSPAITRLIDGNFVISWVASMPGTGDQVRAAMFNGFDGGKKGNEIAVNSSPGIHFNPDIAAFAGTGSDDAAFVISWVGGENGIFRSRFKLFNIDGTKAGQEIAPRDSVGRITAASFSGTDDPREFVSVLSGIDGTEETVLTARVFARTGDSLLTNITHHGDNTINFDPRVADLGGKAVVTWTQRPVPTTGNFGTRVLAAIVDDVRGPPDIVEMNGQAKPIGTSNNGGQHSAAASVVVDDSGTEKIAFAWVDGKIDGSQSTIKARVLSLSLT
jgi:hypothetical protein